MGRTYRIFIGMLALVVVLVVYWNRRSVYVGSFAYNIDDIILNGFNTDRLYLEKLEYRHVDVLSRYLFNEKILNPLILDYDPDKWDTIDKVKSYIRRKVASKDGVTFVIKIKSGTRYNNAINGEDMKFIADGIIGAIGVSYHKYYTINGENADRLLWVYYWIGEPYQKNGFAMEIAPLLISRLFVYSKDVKHFCTCCNNTNTASKKILCKTYDSIKKTTKVSNVNEDKHPTDEGARYFHFFKTE